MATSRSADSTSTTTSVFDEIQEAASDASASAKKAAEVTRQALSKGIYKTAYVSTYGVVFASVFLIELLPHGHLRSSASDENIRLLENKKRGPSLKLRENNSPGSEDSEELVRLPMKTSAKIRTAA